MKKISKVQILIIALSLQFSIAKAQVVAEGGIGHGGGDAFVCNEDGVQKAYLVDVYEFAKSGKLDSLSDVDPGRIMDAIVIYLEMSEPEKLYSHPLGKLDRSGKVEKVSFGWLVSFTSAKLKYSYEDNLPDLQDDNIPPDEVPVGCVKKQLAVQNISKSKVGADLSILGKMSFPQRGLFRYHEVLINLRNKPGQDTTEVRLKVESILRNKKVSFSKIAKKIQPIFTSSHPKKNWARDLATKVGCYKTSDYGGGKPFVCDLFLERVDQSIYDSYREKISKPVLREVPRKMLCHVTSESKNDFNWNIEPMFALENLDILFSKETIKSLRVHFHRDEIPSSANLGKFGNFDIRVSYQNPHSDLALFLERFDPVTQLFYGSVQKDTDDHYGPYSSFGIACISESKVVFEKL